MKGVGNGLRRADPAAPSDGTSGDPTPTRFRSVTYVIKRRTLDWWLDINGDPTPKIAEARHFTTHARGERFRDRVCPRPPEIAADAEWLSPYAVIPSPGSRPSPPEAPK